MTLFAEVYNSFKCCMLGRRCPELACGALQTFLEQLSQVSEHDVMRYCSELCDGLRARLLVNFTAAKQSLSFQLEFKLGPWNNFPLKTLGIGNFDLHAARKCLMELFILYHAMTPAEHVGEHIVISALFALNSETRRQLVLFLRGVASDLLEDVALFIAKARMAMNVEVSVERLHAFLSQRIKIAHHHSPYYVSTVLRKPEIIDVHTKHPESYTTCCEHANTRVKIIDRLGLAYHPLFEQYTRPVPAPHLSPVESSVPYSVVGQVVYRCDLPSQYGQLPELELRGDYPGDDTEPAHDEADDGEPADASGGAAAPASGSGGCSDPPPCEQPASSGDAPGGSGGPPHSVRRGGSGDAPGGGPDSADCAAGEAQTLIEAIEDIENAMSFQHFMSTTSPNTFYSIKPIEDGCDELYTRFDSFRSREKSTCFDSLRAELIAPDLDGELPLGVLIDDTRCTGQTLRRAARFR